MIKRIVLVVTLLISMPAGAVENKLSLPAPELQGGASLMEAIAMRKSTREFSPRKIDDMDLSNILFAAWGISHEDKRTIPTAMNKQDLVVYAVRDDGVWLYNAKERVLELVTKEDIRLLIALQDYVKEAPLTLIYAGKDEKDASMNAAAAYQNVGLYCASKGLNNVVRGYVEKDKIAEVLGLKDDKVIVTQTIGWPYM